MTPASAAATAPRILRPGALATLLAALVLWVAPIAQRDLLDPDEGRYAEIAREMLATGDFVTPRLDALKYFEKPALQYWLTAASFAALGATPLAARLWTALAALLSVAMVFATARRLWGREAADAAGLVAGSMMAMLAGSQILTLDMLATGFLCAALCGFLLARASGGAARARWMLAVWAAMAGAVLTKGLIGVVIPGASLVLLSLWKRDARAWRELAWLRGGALFLLLTAPWFIVVSLRNPEFAPFFFVHEHFARFLTTVHHRQGPAWYFIPLLVLGALPWTTLLPRAVGAAARAARGGDDAARLLLAWSAFVFVFFSASESKLPLYILPMFPALALLLGRLLATLPPRQLAPHAAAMTAFWLVVAAGGTLYLRHANSGALPGAGNAAFAPWLAGGTLAAALLAGAAAWRARGENGRQAVALLALAGLVWIQSAAWGYQAYAPLRSARTLARAVAPYAGPGTEVFEVGDYDPSLSFYLARPVTLVDYLGELELGARAEPGKVVPDLAAFAARWNASAHPVGIAAPGRLEALRAAGVPLRVVAQTPRRVAFVKP